jgi:hypothetical protein
MERCRPRRPPRSAHSAIHRLIPNRNLKAISLSLCASNILGKAASALGAAMVSLFNVKLPKFLTLDSDHITICWGLLIPQMTIFKSHIGVKGSGLQVDLEI